MKILVEGCSNNLGDIAMLENVVLNYKRILPEARIFIIDRCELRTEIFKKKQFFKKFDFKFRQNGLDRMENVSFFWRYKGNLSRLNNNIKLLSFGKLFKAGSIKILEKYPAVLVSKNLNQYCEEFDFLHMPGGGNFNTLFNGELFRKCSIIQTFIEQKKPIMLTGQQMGPFNHSLIKNKVFDIFKNVNFIGLRDSGYSLTHCKESKIDPTHYTVMGDDSLCLNAAEDELVMDILSKINYKSKEFLSVNFRCGPYIKKGSTYLEKFVKFIDTLATKLGLPILIIPISFNLTDSDIASAKRIIELSNYKYKKILDLPSITPSIVKGILGKSIVSIGTSYHFCTFSLSEGVPAICFYTGDYYTHKAIGICSLWDDHRLAFPLEKLNVDLAIMHSTDVIQDLSLREKIRILSYKFKENWQSIFEKQLSENIKKLFA